MIILSGSSNRPLTQSIANHLGLPLSPSHPFSFPNRELCFSLPHSVRGQSVFIVQSGYSAAPSHEGPDEYLMELCLMVRACREAAAERITCVLPCFPYNGDGEDIVENGDGDDIGTVIGNGNGNVIEKGTVIEKGNDSTTSNPTTTHSLTPHHAGKLVANLLQCSGAHQILSLSLSPFDCPFDVLPCSALPITAFQRWSRQLSQHQCVLMSADVNGTGRCLDLSVALGIPLVAWSGGGGSQLMGELPGAGQFGVFLMDDLLDRGLKVTGAIEYLLDWVRNMDDVDGGERKIDGDDGGVDGADGDGDCDNGVDESVNVQPLPQPSQQPSPQKNFHLVSIGVFVTHALFSPGSYALLKRTIQHANSLGIPVSLFLTDSVQQDWEQLEELKSDSNNAGVEIEVMGVGELIAERISEMMDRIG